MNSDLAWETETSGDTGHCGWDEMVEVTIGRSCQLESTETDVVQSLVVDAVSFVSVLNQLMNRQCRIVWFDNCVRHLYTTAATTSPNSTNTILITTDTTNILLADRQLVRSNWRTELNINEELPDEN